MRSTNVLLKSYLFLYVAFYEILMIPEFYTYNCPCMTLIQLYGKYDASSFVNFNALFNRLEITSYSTSIHWLYLQDRDRLSGGALPQPTRRPPGPGGRASGPLGPDLLHGAAACPLRALRTSSAVDVSPNHLSNTPTMLRLDRHEPVDFRHYMVLHGI